TSSKPSSLTRNSSLASKRNLRGNNRAVTERRQEGRLLATELEAWMRAERARLSRSSPVAEPIDYMLKRWEGYPKCGCRTRKPRRVVAW
ncbi:hypothetical protein NKH79_34190, partial [Mesorhizobium sp. M0977]